MGDVRRDYLNRCKTLKEHLDEFALLLSRAQDGDLISIQRELLDQSRVVSKALQGVDVLASDQERLEDELLEEEGLLRESAPVLFDSREHHTYNLLRSHGFDFPGHAPSDEQPPSLSLSDVRDDLAPEVEEYFSKLREVDALEERLLQMKHDRSRDDFELDPDATSGDDEPFVVLEHESGQESLLQQLSQARANLQTAKSILPPASELHQSELEREEGLVVDEFSKGNALTTPMPSNLPRPDLQMTQLLDKSGLDLQAPDDETDGTSEKTDFVQQWLSDQVEQSKEELLQDHQHLQEQSQQPHPSNSLQAGEQSFHETGRQTISSELARWSVQANAAGTPVRPDSSRSEGQLNLRFLHRRDTAASQVMNQSQRTLARYEALSLPGTPL